VSESEGKEKGGREATLIQSGEVPGEKPLTRTKHSAIGQETQAHSGAAGPTIDMRARALALAAHGFPVFPVTANDKKPPVHMGWQERATSDPDKVRAMWTSSATGEAQDYNIGIRTGVPLSSGNAFFVVDLDTTPEIKAGERYAALLAAVPDLQKTVRARAPGKGGNRGGHLIFLLPAGEEVRNSVKKLIGVPGVDVRGKGGYILGPGSIINGREYSWEPGASPADMAIAPATPALLALCFARAAAEPSEGTAQETAKFEDEWSTAHAIAFIEGAEPDAGAGNRHEPMIRIAHKLFDFGLTARTAAALIEEHWPEAVHIGDLSYQVESLAAGRKNEWGTEHISTIFEAHEGEFDKLVEIAKEPNGDAPAKSENDDGPETFCLADLAGKDIPVRKWLIKDYIPDWAVTMLSGDGGVGKSLLALQSGVSICTRRPWVGMEPVKSGPVIYASAEDDSDEIHIRASDIVRAEGIGLDALTGFHVWPLAGLDAVMGMPDGNGRVRPTKLWGKFVRICERVKPALIILDTLADIYGGDENVRTQARQFITQLRGLAIRLKCAVLLLSHPSLSGMNSGSGTSGSTGWHNSVRGRLYLTRPTQGALSKDPKARVLTTKKQNYAGGYGDERQLRWEAGRFRHIEGNVHVVEADAIDAIAGALFASGVAGEIQASEIVRGAPAEMREGLPSRANNLSRDIDDALKARGLTLGDDGAVISTDAGALRLTKRGRGIAGGYWFEALGAKDVH